MGGFRRSRNAQQVGQVADGCRQEGILPAIESSHAIAQAIENAKKRSPDDVIVVCLSGRGDKDVYEIARLTGQDL